MWEKVPILRGNWTESYKNSSDDLLFVWISTEFFEWFLMIWYNIPDEINYIEMPIAADKDIRLELNDVINGKSNKKMGQFLIDVNISIVMTHTLDCQI